MRHIKSWARPVFILLFLITPVYGAEEVDLETMKGDTQIFEAVLREMLNQTFESPFAVDSEPQATYLPDYGVVVSFRIRINRASLSPKLAGIRALTGSSATLSKSDQIKKIKSRLLEAISNHAGAIQQVRPADHISVCAHIEDRNELNPSEKETIVVFTVRKNDLDQLNRGRLDVDEFKSRVTVVEY